MSQCSKGLQLTDSRTFSSSSMITCLGTGVEITSINEEFLAMSLLSSLMAMNRHAKISSPSVALSLCVVLFKCLQRRLSANMAVDFGKPNGSQMP